MESMESMDQRSIDLDGWMVGSWIDEWIASLRGRIDGSMDRSILSGVVALRELSFVGGGLETIDFNVRLSVSLSL